MSKICDVLTEMADIASLVKQPGVNEVVKVGLVTSVAHKIKAMPTFSASDAAKLMTALTSAAFPSAHSEAMQDAVNVRLACSMYENVPKAVMKPQLLTSVLNYITQGEWDRIQHPSANPSVVMSVLMGRLQGLGIRSLNEQTVKWCVCIVVYEAKRTTHHWPDYHQIWAWVQDFKREFEAYKTPTDVDHLKTFPMDPSGLSEGHFAAAYDESDPPIRMQLQGFQSLGAHIPLRANSFFCKGRKDKWEVQAMGMCGAHCNN